MLPFRVEKISRMCILLLWKIRKRDRDGREAWDIGSLFLFFEKSEEEEENRVLPWPERARGKEPHRIFVSSGKPPDRDPGTAPFSVGEEEGGFISACRRLQ